MKVEVLNGVSVISQYSNYESDESGYYDLTVFKVGSNFFENMEMKVQKGDYKKYDVCDQTGDIDSCAKLAWEKVWNDQKNGNINRAYSVDYQSTVTAEYSEDGKVHCVLYIAVGDRL